MKFLIFLLVFVVVALVLVWVGGMVLEFFSDESKERRSSKKANTARLTTRTKQLTEAKKALLKIASNNSGNPVLDAQLALEDIQRLELLELEN